MKEMEPFMDQRLTSNYLILLEDNINAVLVNLISNYQSDLTFNSDQKKLNNKNPNNKKNKNLKRKKLN
jgi:hypothetical protein